MNYVILEHNWNGIHFDLMLHQDNSLKTWRLTNRLQEGIQTATSLADHRLDYLTYEGPVSGNRGTVKRIASGEYTTVAKSESQWQVTLRGILRGTMKLTHLKKENWQLDWQPAT